MLRARFLIAVLLVALLAAVPESLFAVDPEPYVEPEPFAAPSLYVGCTLGQNWNGFPVHLSPDYENTGATEKLDVTLPLYVTWILDTSVSTVSQAVSPPKLITEYSWFQNSSFKVLTAQVETTSLYTNCPEDQQLEAPVVNTYPLSAGGQLHVEDVHGGIGTMTLIRLRRETSPTTGILLYVSWASPRTRHDSDTGNSNLHCTPGTEWTREAQFLSPPTLYRAYFDAKTVEWPSADLAPTSPRAVDASDLSTFSTLWSAHILRWGFANENPANSPTFQADIANIDLQYALDGADLSAMGADLGKSCKVDKADEREDAETIMAWFGFTLTGRSIVIGANGETVPEYELSDPGQNLVARSDPYGYRNRTTSEQAAPWTRVKQLFR